MLSVLFLAAPALGQAQPGRIAGVVSDSLTGTPLSGVTVELFQEGAAAARPLRSVVTDGRGYFQMLDLEPGRYRLTATRLGYAPASLSVASSADQTVEITLSALPFTVDPIVVSATLSEMTRFEAPASISVIQRPEIEESEAFTPVDYLRDVPGVDFAAKGVMTNTFSTRGPREVTAASLLVLSDYRYAAVPALGFNTGLLIPGIADDIERIEVVRGPGAVIYGPNSRRGVVHFIKRSPLEGRETSLSLAGGERSLVDLSLRHAQPLSSNFGFKVSGRYASARDWVFSDPAEVQARADAIAAGNPDSLLIGARKDHVEDLEAEARIDWQASSATSVTTTFGITTATGIETSPEAGAAQVRDWRYGYFQTRLGWNNLFLNLLYNWNDAGDTYNLRTAQRFVDQSRLFAAQLQNQTGVGPASLLYGLDFRWTIPRTGGTLHGRFEDDDHLLETGAYLYSTVALSPALEAIGALRADHHNRLDDPFFLSPRAAVVYKPGVTHALRLSYTRSFAQPSTRDLFIDIPLGPLGPLPFQLRLTGSEGDGFTFRRDCGGPCMRVPEAFGGDPEVYLPADATLMWPVVVALLQQQGIDLSGIPAPDGSQVGTDLARLDLATGAFVPVGAGDIKDVSPVKRVVENVFELGYKGFIDERVFLGADMYYTRASDVFATTSSVNTANVFLDAETLAGYLAGFMPQDVAQQTAAGIAQIPLGTISPEQVAGADLLVFTPAQQGGSFSYWGIDLMLSADVSERFSLSASYSWISKDSTDLGSLNDFLVFQVPKHKGSGSVRYRDEASGLEGHVSGRVVSDFSVRSPAYVGVVESYTAFDVGVAYRLPWMRNAKLSLEALNVFDNRHVEFIGTPAIGRLALMRLQFVF